MFGEGGWCKSLESMCTAHVKLPTEHILHLLPFYRACRAVSFSLIISYEDTLMFGEAS